MPKIPDCDRGRFYAYSHLLVCAVHHGGTASYSCPDFVLDPEYPRQRFVDVLGLQRQTGELLNLLDTHPILTGKCPSCGVEMERDYRAVVHSDIAHVVGWMMRFENLETGDSEA